MAGVATMSVSDVRSVTDAEAMLAQLDLEEADVARELEQLLEQQTQMDIKMASFQHMLPSLQSLHSDSSELSEAIAKASRLAESVSSKVRIIDLAKTRVYEAKRRVDDVIDLKSCVDGVQYAMNQGDFEKAADYIHRYLTLDESILLESSADSAKGSSTVSSSFALLREYEHKLKDLVRSKFTEARDSNDLQGIERFIKIFPLLNLRQEGLELFSQYLTAQIESSCHDHLSSATQASGDRVGVVYADTLTLLYETIARAVEKYQPLVENCYGQTWLPVMIKNLQGECDRQTTKILRQLQEERMVEHKFQTVSSALKSRSAVGAIRPDILELDTLLTELSLCSARTELYFRFLRRKAEATSSKGEEVEAGLEINNVIKRSETNQLLQELVGKYTHIENYFMREGLTKAISMDSCNADGLTSSMADDIFFVLQKCSRRAFASGNVDGACAMLNHASSLLISDYRVALQTRLKASLPTSGLDQLSGMLQSKLQASRSGGRAGGGDSEANKPSTTIALNDIEVSIENIQRLSKELQVECSKLTNQTTASAQSMYKNKLDSCLTEFSNAVKSFKELREDGVVRMVELMILPRLRPSLETFSTLSHILTEDDFANFEINDPFVQQVVSTFEATLSEVKQGLLGSVFELVLSGSIDQVTNILEQQIFKSSFNQLGGVQLDKDIRTLVGYLSAQTQWPVRDKFARLTQVITVLSLDSAGELLDIWGANAGPLMWRLTPPEARKVLGLRSDFRPEEIAVLKL